MLPANIALWALFFAQGQQDVSKLIDKVVAGEPKASDIIAASYVAAVKKYGRQPASLDEKLEKLALICRAIWELVREHYSLADDDLLNKVKEIDLLDGSLDGKVTIAPKACSKCGRPVSKRHMRCLYCGAEDLVDTPFDSL